MTRTALVTGVVGGIGSAIARRLADDGARVTVTDLPGEQLDEAAARLGLPAIAADLGRKDDVEAMADRLRANGGVDILVSAAGGVRG